MKKDTSWENVGSWYDKIVGAKGSYYHQSIVFPRSLRLLQLDQAHSVLDLGCGNGALARHLPKHIQYVGVDLSKDLIKKAQNYQVKTPAKKRFIVADATQKLPIQDTFDRATYILSLQNMDPLQNAIQTAYTHLNDGGRLVLVLNHPCFRIPRQSTWIVNREKKWQSRCIHAYMQPMKIPIFMRPSAGQEEVTYSFHRSISDYTKALSSQGFTILDMEEWVSDKTSTGPLAKMENRARENFPLFLAIVAEKSR